MFQKGEEVQVIMHFMKFLKGIETKMENKGEELVITIKGDKEKIAMFEKKLNALKELHSGCCEGEDCDCK